MVRPVWAEIDLSAIADNMQAIKSWVTPKTEIMAVVKANAYGHGAVEVARTCMANGASRLAVAIVAEGIELRNNGFSAPILVMGYTPPEQCQLLLDYNLTQTVFSLEQAKIISKLAAAAKKTIQIHLKVDTGMGRLGFLEHQLEELVSATKLPGLQVEGVFTHFATADEADKSYTLAQLNLFNRQLTELDKIGLKPPIVHAANSAGIIQYPDSHFNLVRPGLMLYGMYPSNQVDQNNVSIRPAMSFKAKVAHVKKVAKDTSISYGCTYQAPKNSVIATLPLGYADGYSRLLSNKGKVLINGHLARVVGRVCMDQIIVDVTQIPDVKVGAEVVLFGYSSEGHWLPIEEIAALAGTINYELVCKVSYRVPRIYI
ncbi:MAG: alanine racemase [Bacillota bacterium]|nr:alanine racemase [Bacillota bacterium]